MALNVAAVERDRDVVSGLEGEREREVVSG